MRGFAILTLIVLAIWVLWPYIGRWLRRKSSEKAEDFLRDAMGMPPRPGSRKDRKQRKAQRERQNARGDYYSSGAQSDDRYNRGGYSRSDRYGREESILPKEYAEDVEYVETKDYSSAESVKSDKDTRIYHESQVSDAEWTEIKEKKTTK